MSSTRIPPGAICMAVYQPDLALLEAQIVSIQSQGLGQWICHIGVDGPDPSVVDFVKRLVASDDRFIVHSFSQNVGFYRNFERLVVLGAKDSTWIALSDQDDYWYPQKLSTLVSKLMETGADAVVGQAQVVEAAGGVRAITRRKLVRMSDLLLDNQVTGSTSVFRSSSVLGALPFPPPRASSYHDHWLGVWAMAGSGIEVLPAVLQNYVQHDGNVLGEERRGRFHARTARLARASRQGGMWRFLAVERWGWRVRMARTVLERMTQPSAAEQLEIIAKGSLSAALVQRVLAGVVRRDIPFLRAVALLTGALGWTLRPRWRDAA